MRNKTQILKTPPPLLSLLPRLSCTSSPFTSSSKWCRGIENGGCGQFITGCLCCSFVLKRRTPHTLKHGVPPRAVKSSVNFSNMESFNRLQFFTNCSSVAPSRWCSSSGTACSSLGAHGGVIGPDTCSSACFSLHESTSCQEPASGQASHWVTASSGHPAVLVCGPPGAVGGYLSTPELHGLQGDSLSHHSLHLRLQGNLFSTWASFSFTDLGVCRTVCLTYSHSDAFAVTFAPS